MIPWQLAFSEPFKRLWHFTGFMLKANEVVLNDGSTYQDVVVLPSGDCVLIETQNEAGQNILREIHLNKIKHIDYQDEQSVYFVRGLALAELAMSVDEMQEFMEDRGWNNEDLIEALKEASSTEDEEVAAAAAAAAAAPATNLPKGLDGSNPYGGGN